MSHTHTHSKTHTHTHTHTHNAHDLPDPSSSRMVLAAVLRVRSEQLCEQVHTLPLAPSMCGLLSWCDVCSSLTQCPELSKARQEAFDTFRRDYAENDAIEQQKRTLKTK